ncbi:calcium-binding and coiled-coil domain-containing protein 1 [Striga asiatica]|uniref:Calcium-binding and coiled-coil domain-containing protein 1 n=1 Tax=Striga asiatica TaxID=4170 RepID=A0A5A7QK24_STRAF|nr:calcium-binding and coiled-coil domain-containing protein 1 [Striga asiatica]
MTTFEAWDIRNCDHNEKEGSNGMALCASKTKKLNGHGYKQWLKSQGIKARGSDLSIEKRSEPSQSEVKATEPNSLHKGENATTANSVSHPQEERLDFLLRRVKDADYAKESNITNNFTQAKNNSEENSEKQGSPCNMDKSEVKKEPEICNAHISKSTKPNIVEYWVPVSFSERLETAPRKRRKEEASAQTKPAPGKRRRKARNTFYQFPTIIKRKIRTKLQNRGKVQKLSAETIKRRKVSSWVNLQIPALGRAPPSQHHSLPPADERRTTQKDGHPHDTAIVPQSVCKALEMELEVLQKEKNDLLKLHEEKKLQSKMACEKEIEEIRKKYDVLLQNAEVALLEEKGVLEAKCKKVEAHKSLAEAVMQTDTFVGQSIAEVTSNYSIDEMYKLFDQWSRSKPVTGPSQVVKSSEAQVPIQESLPSKPEAFQSLPNPMASSEIASSLPIEQSLATTNFQASLVATGPNQPLPGPSLMGPCPSLTPMLHIPQTLVGGQVSPAPHFRHMWPPQPIVPPGLLPFPCDGIFLPVSLLPLTSHVPGLQSTFSSFWASSPFDRLPL